MDEIEINIKKEIEPSIVEKASIFFSEKTNEYIGKTKNKLISQIDELILLIESENYDEALPLGYFLIMQARKFFTGEEIFYRYYKLNIKTDDIKDKEGLFLGGGHITEVETEVVFVTEEELQKYVKVYNEELKLSKFAQLLDEKEKEKLYEEKIKEHREKLSMLQKILKEDYTTAEGITITLLRLHRKSVEKISNIKIPDKKTDEIGYYNAYKSISNKYPYIFKNSTKGYKYQFFNLGRIAETYDIAISMMKSKSNKRFSQYDILRNMVSNESLKQDNLEATQGADNPYDRVSVKATQNPNSLASKIQILKQLKNIKMALEKDRMKPKDFEEIFYATSGANKNITKEGAEAIKNRIKEIEKTLEKSVKEIENKNNLTK